MESEMHINSKLEGDKSLLHLANSISADATSSNPTPLPSWIDSKLLKEGHDFIRRNFFSVFFAHFISLIFLLCYSPVRIVLFKTGKSEDESRSRIRYFSTLLHIKMWYESSDLLDENSQAFKDIQSIRKIHNGVGKRLAAETEKNQTDAMKKPEMKLEIHPAEEADSDGDILRSAIQSDLGILNEDNNNNNVNPNPDWTSKRCHTMSQLDMAVTQFCFMGFVQMFPEKVGISPEGNSRGLEGFVHLWAVIGHFLGIEEDFNICLERNSKLREAVWEQVLIPEFQNCHLGTIKLWKSLVNGAASYIYFISVKSVLCFIIDCFFSNEKESQFKKLLSVCDWALYVTMKYCFSSWLKWNCARGFFNGILRYAIWLASVRFYITGEINKSFFWRLR